MARITQKEFSERFLEGEIDLSPREVTAEEGGLVVELDRMPYEKTALRLREIVQREDGNRTMYLKVGDTMVSMGEVNPSIELFNELERLLTTLGVVIKENGEEIDRTNYLSLSTLPVLTESDYLV